jgi:RNA polymerase sigma factor (TIGR02999 family)
MAEPPVPPAGATPDDLFTVVYERLKMLASRQLARGPRATLDTTSLVHEVYLRLGRERALSFEYQEHFFAYAARAMRHVMIDHARARTRQKAGGEWIRVTLTDDDRKQKAIASAEEALALERALTALEREDERAARVVEMSYFAGLSHQQIADALGVGVRTIERDWRYARAVLRNWLG